MLSKPWQAAVSTVLLVAPGGSVAATTRFTVEHQVVVRGARTSQRIPASIPASEAYYWSRRWQEDEAASRAELAAGETTSFTSAADMVTWLLSDDDV